MEWDCLIAKIWMACFKHLLHFRNCIVHTKILFLLIKNAAWGKPDFYLSNFLVLMFARHWWWYFQAKTEEQMLPREQEGQRTLALHTFLARSQHQTRFVALYWDGRSWGWHLNCCQLVGALVCSRFFPSYTHFRKRFTVCPTLRLIILI